VVSCAALTTAPQSPPAPPPVCPTVLLRIVNEWLKTVLPSGRGPRRAGRPKAALYLISSYAFWCVLTSAICEAVGWRNCGNDSAHDNSLADSMILLF
jgi:hypothetical protein